MRFPYLHDDRVVRLLLAYWPPRRRVLPLWRRFDPDAPTGAHRLLR